MNLHRPGTTGRRFAAASIYCCLLVLAAQVTDGDTAQVRDKPLTLEALTAPVALHRGSYEELKEEPHITLTDFTLADGSTITLELDAFDVLAPDATLIAGTSAGEVPADRPRVALFRGWVVDGPASYVFLSLSPYGVYGTIERAGALHVISSGPHDSALPTVVYNLTTLPEGAIEWLPFTCGAMPLPDLEPEPFDDSRGAGSRTSHCRRVRIAIETDSQFTGRLFGGSGSAAGAYATALIGAVSEIYRRDFETELEIGYLRVWTDGDDPWDQGDAGSQLSQFRDYWNEYMGDVERNIAHFLSGRALGGGVAWVGVLCPSGYSYALSGDLGGSFPYPLQDYHWNNWDPFVVAHEIGHNFGAPHTHDLMPPADGCGLGDCSDAYGGTIMSYCHTCAGGMSNIRLSFHPRIIDESVTPYLGAVEHCLESAGPAILTQPEPSQVVCDGQTVALSVSTDSPFASYQWRRGTTELSDGGDIIGSTSATLGILNVSPAYAGADYNCVVTDTWTGCATVSDDAEIVVDTHGAVITAQPRDATVAVGGALLLTVGTADLSMFYSYQWRKDGVALVDDGHVVGATMPELGIYDVTTADAGAYDCQITALLGIGCTVVSEAAHVTVGALIGDVDGDGDVDLGDLAELLAAYRHCAGEPEFNPAADFDQSGCVDLSDLSALLVSYGIP